jgi:hypothetical protein
MGWRGSGDRRGGRFVAARCARITVLVIPLLISGLPLGLFDVGTLPTTGAAVGFAIAGPPPQVVVNETLTVRNQTTNNLSDFWGTGLNPGYNLTNLTNETEGTPVNWVVWPAGDVADTFNMTNGTTWTNGVSTRILNNESQFVAACKAISCRAIFTVPGEIDNPTLGAYEVWYTERVLNFTPAFWEIGNEPFRWQHFGQNWTRWNSIALPPPTPTQYAWVVHAYIAAMKNVDPNLRFIGLPGIGNGAGPDWQWLTATVQINGPNLSAVAVHDYPGEDGTKNATLGNFLGSLTANKTYMVTRFAADEKAVRSAVANISCTTCSIQFFVDEFGAITQQSYDQAYMDSYAEIPFVTAELLMMSESNVSNADLFELRSDYNGSLFNGVGLPFPLDTLYTQVLPHYDTFPLNTSVTGTLQEGIFAGVSESPSANSITLLAVNTNPTQTVQLNVAGGVFPSWGTYEAWTETNSTSFPNGTVAQSYGSENGTGWVLPPLGVLLVSMCRSNASVGSGGQYPLTFCESGLPSGKSWSVTVGSTTLSSTSGTITFPEPNGNYSYTIGRLAGWSTANTTGTITVNGTPASVEVPWAAFTYPVTFNETGLPSGTNWTVTLDGTLYGSNTTSLTGFAPNGTQPFDLGTVSGWRPANLTGVVSGWTPPNATGSVFVNATSVWVNVTWSEVTYVVTVHQKGLIPSSSNWSIVLGGLAGYNSTGGTIEFEEPNGTYSFTVGSIPGFTPDAASGSVGVRGYSKSVPITFATNSTVHAIWFNETGLPSGTDWDVTLNGTGQSATSTTITFAEPNGTYAYTLGGAAGWRPPAYAGTVSVRGMVTTVGINYVPFDYNVSFHETGLPTPMPSGNWSVTLNGTNLTSTTSVITFLEPNGTYTYKIGPEPGYTTSSCSGLVEVNGHPAGCTVKWTVFLWTVTFTESGLHSGGGATTWTLEVAGKSPHKSPLSAPPYSEGFANGTYNFTATTSISGWGPDPTVGSFNVTGRPVSVTVRFTPVYSVSFVATGFPPLTSWSVDVNGSVTDSNGSTIQVVEPNGTYNYSVPAVSGLVRTPTSGQVRVNGATVLVAISFSPSTAPVTFTESGLPGGTNWSVTLNGTSGNLTNYSYGGTSVTFELVNASYTYRVNSITGYRIENETGNLSEVGQALSFNVTFLPTFYSVTFSAAGLPTGTNWSVTIGGTTNYSGGAPTITVLEVNGNYSYNDSSGDSRYAPTSYHSTFAVNGSAILMNLTFLQVNYTVNFTESGLPVGSYWYLTFNGTYAFGYLEGPGASIISFFGEVNGSYAYEIYDIPGYQQSNISYIGNLTVAGQSISVVLAFTPFSYGVSFEESGLPAGKNWSVTFNGTPESMVTSGGNDTLVFPNVPNGTYQYSISDVSGWHESSIPYSGTVTVNGESVAITVTFTLVTYEVTLSESGLPSGLEWSVTVNGDSRNLLTDGGTDTLTWTGLANGSYVYSIMGLSGWDQSNLTYHGLLTVSGLQEPINGIAVGYAASLDYHLVTFLVTVQELGLPNGTSWSATVGGSTLSSTTPTIQFALPNGTYPYSIASVPNYSRTATGTLQVTGNPVQHNVPFSLVRYAVTWTETGLPLGTNWSVTVGGMTVNSTTDQIVFFLANGSVLWKASAGPGFSLTPANGTVVVQGAIQAVSITYVAPPETYEITFTESGLPPNSDWSVSIGSVTHYSMGSASIAFQETNGTFNFTVQPILGYTASEATGSVILDGTASSVSIRFISTSLPSVAPRGLSSLDWAIVIGVSALIVLMLLLSLAMRRRGPSKNPGSARMPRPSAPTPPTAQGPPSGPKPPGSSP